MSYIPSSAMPHATIDDIDEDEFEDFEEGGEFEDEEGQLSRRARMREMVRERPKTSIAAGAALIAGLAAAAAIPFLARDTKSASTARKRPSAKSPAGKSANGKSASGKGVNGKSANKASTAKPSTAKKRPATKSASRSKSANGKTASKTS